MSKILLALAILTGGAGGFLGVRNVTNRLTRQMNAHRDACQAETQQLAGLQTEQADLAQRMRQLKASLAESQPVAENTLWSALRTNRADRLPAELRQRVLQELSFNWQFSPDFIVVTKQALRDTRGPVPNDAKLPTGWILTDGKLSEVAVRILALTPGARSQVDAVLQRAQADFGDWALEHVQRSEPTDDLLANYVLPSNPSLWAGFTTNLALAVGRERAGLILGIAADQLGSELGLGQRRESMTLKREEDGSVQRLKAEIDGQQGFRWGYLPEVAFPTAFRPIFPKGWADVAKREGFELPSSEPKEK